MTSEQVWLAAAGAVALAALVLALLACTPGAARRVAGRRAGRAGRGSWSRPATDAPRPAVDDADASTYVITGLDATDRDEPGRAPVAVPIDGRLFADIVARETVVKAASWTAGLRRALAPESRNRIRFHVRQETKRAGRERRAETKQALREFRARERAMRSGGRRLMGRPLWFVAGAGVGVYAAARARRAAEALTADGLRDRLRGWQVGARHVRRRGAPGPHRAGNRVARAAGPEAHFNGLDSRTDEQHRQMKDQH